jgi:hypothetical protein
MNNGKGLTKNDAKELTKNDAKELAKKKNDKELAKDIEEAIIAIIRAGLKNKKEKDGKFLQTYKKQLTEIRTAENINEYIIEKAKRLFPNKERYDKIMENNQTWYKNEKQIFKTIEKLNQSYYDIAKDHFTTEEEIDKELDDFINAED